ncbi:MAG: HU family DNA-binding protein [Oscillospiraceae bacterium]|nr:HU family DNA-binding protein [Oscillospiraceae bacterium]
MVKADLITKIAEKTGATKKDSEIFLTAVVECISESLAEGEPVKIVGFGAFEVRERAAREGVHPQTLKPLKIPAARVPVFKAGKPLKELVAVKPKSKKRKKK